MLYSILKDAAQHIDALTCAQLEGAAADLRNAALVIKHAGHFRGALTCRDTGAVCAVGAIDLATYKRLVQPIKGVWGTFIHDEYADSGAYRASHAVVALADFVPDDLCASCRGDFECHCGEDCGRRGLEPFEKVTHWNDNHAVTPDLAIGIINCAADRAAAKAHEKRAMLTGDRVLAAV